MANIGIFSIKFTGDAKQLEQTFTKVGVKANLFANAISGGLQLAARAGANFVTSAINIAKENENTLTSFKNLTGSVAEASKLYKDLLDFASRTPFSSKEIQSGATTLLGFGLSADEATSALKDLGAAAAANADTDLKRLVVSYGQIQGANVAMTKDLREFVNNGIPIYQILSQTLGVSVSEINKLASEGKITGDVITKAFRESAAEGGRFANTLIDQSNTLSGLTSTLKDNYAITLGQLAQNLLPAAKEAAKGFNNILLNMQKYFESDAGEQFGIKLAAGVRAGFETAGTTIKTALLKIELALAKTVATFSGFNQEAKTKVEVLEVALKAMESTTTSFQQAYQQALEEIQRDQVWADLLNNLDSGIKAFDELDQSIGGGDGGGGVTGSLKEAKDELLEFIVAQDEASQRLVKLAREREEIEAKLAKANIAPNLVSGLTDGKGKAGNLGGQLDTNDLTFGVTVEELDAKAIATERLAAANKTLAETIQSAGQVAGTFGAKLQEAYNQGATGARAFAAAAVESAKEVIAAQIREGVVTAAAKALAKVPFPFNIVLAGIAGGAAEALFRSLVSKIKIPAFGDGGVVYGPTLALIGEKGPEAVVPLGRGNGSNGMRVEIAGVQRGVDTYWQNANVGMVGRLIYGNR